MRFSNYLKLFLFIFILNSCKSGVSEKSDFDKWELPPFIGDTLIIVFDTSDSLSFKRNEFVNDDEYIFYRKYFIASPNLIVNLGHNPFDGKGKISKSKMFKYPILYDSISTFNDWASLDYQTYYLIEKDQLFNNKDEMVDFVEITMSVKGEI